MNEQQLKQLTVFSVLSQKFPDSLNKQTRPSLPHLPRRVLMLIPSDRRQIEPEKARAFFSKVIEPTASTGVGFIVVGHVLRSLPPFLKALEKVGEILAVIPKPRSISDQYLPQIQSQYPLYFLDREFTGDPHQVIQFIQRLRPSGRFMIIDIGGYFHQVVHDLKQHFGDRFIGVVEDTENGHQKYESVVPLNVPCVSVARSLAKRTEDWNVGKSIVFSAEALIRQEGLLFADQVITVFGFGKIGQSIAHNLRARGYDVYVWDIDPNQRIYAQCINYRVRPRPDLLAASDLFFCATGNQALTVQDMPHLKPHAYAFSVTSADDELDPELFVRCDSLIRDGEFSRARFGDRTLHLGNHGNAVNFIHGAEVGPYIYLVQAAILSGVQTLLQGESASGFVGQLDRQTEMRNAELFEAYFGSAQPTRTGGVL